MTATQVFMLFLKKELPINEYLFFMHHLSRRRKGGKVKPVLEKEFVEKYLCRANRTLGGFMTRLFVLCPNLLRYGMNNPTYNKIYNGLKPRYFRWQQNEIDAYYFNKHVNSTCISVYRSKWHRFLEEHIKSDKKFNSIYKEGETYNYEYKQ